MIKFVLQSLCLEDHMKTIGIDQSLINRPSVEHKCLNNIENIYQHAGKCYDQKNLKDIPDTDMFSTTEEVTDASPSLRITQITVKTSARKSLCLFTNIFDVKKITAVRCVESAKSKSRAIKVGNSLWANKKERKGHSKIND